MGMTAILFNGAEPSNKFSTLFRQKVPCKILWKLLKAVSEKKTFQNYTFLYMYKAQGQGQITHTEQSFDCNLKVLLL